MSTKAGARLIIAVLRVERPMGTEDLSRLTGMPLDKVREAALSLFVDGHLTQERVESGPIWRAMGRLTGCDDILTAMIPGAATSADISDATGLRRSTVQRWLSRLEDQDVVARVRRRRPPGVQGANLILWGLLVQRTTKRWMWKRWGRLRSHA